MVELAHEEPHVSGRASWLRAAVMGANDGILSTASLIAGVAAAQSAGREDVLLAGLAGMIAGAISMAAGEYVSVSSQADAEREDIAQESRELKTNPHGELDELKRIYEARGLEPELASRVAEALTRHDALGAHLRDEIGITELTTPKPLEAALVSAVTFAAGAAAPLAVAFATPREAMLLSVPAATLLALAVLGALGARAGGANMARASLRVVIWGMLGLAASAAVGALFGVSAV